MRIARLKLREAVHQPAFFVAVICGLWAGCANQSAPTPPPLPPMPSVGEPRYPKISEVVPEEILKRAIAIAETGAASSAVETLDAIRDAEERRTAGLQLVTELSARNAKLAAEVALALSKGPTQVVALEKASSSWARQDPEVALRWVFNLSAADTGPIARRAMARTLAQNDANATIRRLKELPNGRVRDEMIGYAAGAWVQHDPEGAISWLGKEPKDASLERLSLTMAFELAQINPAGAIKMAEDIPEGRERWLIYSQIGQTWAAVDQEAAMRWMNQLKSRDAQDAMLAGINTGLGTESRRARPFPINPAPLRGRAAYAAIVQTDPVTFSEWLSAQPQPIARDEAILSFIRERGALDAGAIGNWIINLDEESVKRRAIEIYFREIVRGDPSTAAGWLSSLPASYRSNDMLEQTARALGKMNPAVVESLVREMTLSQFEQSKLITEILK